MPYSISPGQQDKINRETKVEMLTGLGINLGELGLNLIARLNEVALNLLQHCPILSFLNSAARFSMKSPGCENFESEGLALTHGNTSQSKIAFQHSTPTHLTLL
jgi:hypothetical protein